MTDYVFETNTMEIPDCVKNRPAGTSTDRAMIEFLQATNPTLLVGGMHLDRETGLLEVSVRKPVEQRAPK